MTRRLKAIAILGLGLLLLPAAVNATVLDVPPPAAEQRSGDAVKDIPAPAPTGTAAAPAAVAPGTQTYAQREAAAKGLETFEGGGAGIYIGGSTVGIVLVVLLLVVLL